MSNACRLHLHDSHSGGVSGEVTGPTPNTLGHTFVDQIKPLSSLIHLRVGEREKHLSHELLSCPSFVSIKDQTVLASSRPCVICMLLINARESAASRFMLFINSIMASNKASCPSSLLTPCPSSLLTSSDPLILFEATAMATTSKCYLHTAGSAVRLFRPVTQTKIVMPLATSVDQRSNTRAQQSRNT